MLNCIIRILLLAFIAIPTLAQDSVKQVRVSTDIAKLITNTSSSNKDVQLAIDALLKKDTYYTLELGQGSSSIDNSLLNYATSNRFIKLGLDKSLLIPISNKDLDIAFVGFRLAATSINRSEGEYNTSHSYWGTTEGKVQSARFFAPWFEFLGGIKVDVLPSITAGWTLRWKFMLNHTQLSELPPAYIAGFGNASNATAFDFNFYIGYKLFCKSLRK
jgi:hypothetical protein